MQQVLYWFSGILSHVIFTNNCEIDDAIITKEKTMAQRLSSFETSLGAPRASLTLEPRNIFELQLPHL